jgi:hypothetical protein
VKVAEAGLGEIVENGSNEMADVIGDIADGAGAGAAAQTAAAQTAAALTAAAEIAVPG